MKIGKMVDTPTTCIIGAGVAGQLICEALTRPGRAVKTVLVDPNGLQIRDRFWIAPSRKPLPAVLKNQAQMHTVIALARKERRLRSDSLHTLNSRAIGEALIERPEHVEVFDSARVEAIDAQDTGAVVHTTKGSIQCRYVFDTRPEAGGRISSQEWAIIGWSAQVESDHGFDPDFSLSPAQLVDNAVEFTQRTRFGERTLIERVRICAPGDDAPDLDKRLLAEISEPVDPNLTFRSVWPVVPPQGDERDKSVYRIRAGAGGLRFTNGIEAIRLAEWTEKTSQALIAGRAPAPLRRASLASQIAHLLFLRQLRAGPERTAAYLNTIMSKLDPDSSLMTLGGHPSWPTLFQLIWRQLRP
jgi:hypothetical protein